MQVLQKNVGPRVGQATVQLNRGKLKCIKTHGRVLGEFCLKALENALTSKSWKARCAKFGPVILSRLINTGIVRKISKGSPLGVDGEGGGGATQWGLGQ